MIDGGCDRASVCFAVLRAALFVAAAAPGLCPSAALAGTAEANSTNRWFWKYYDQSSNSHNYYFASSALAATFSYEAQAWNEGGTSGLKTYGPDTKFDNVGGAPAAKHWPFDIGARVPTPGTTKARGTFTGFSVTDFLAIYGPYFSDGAAHAVVEEGTIPVGGFGRAKATLKDPWNVDFPVLTNPLDEIEFRHLLDITGSDLDISGPNSSGSLGWHVAMEGLPGYESYVFDYSLSKDAGVFASTLLVAPDVRIFLNDFSDSLEFNPLTEVTASELKDYLDSFNVLGGGWSLGGTPVRIGLAYTIANDALGVGEDSATRLFYLHSDAAAETMASRPVPEASSLLLAGMGLSSLALAARRLRKAIR